MLRELCYQFIAPIDPHIANEPVPSIQHNGLARGLPAGTYFKKGKAGSEIALNKYVLRIRTTETESL